jgi:hypothetical protein
MLPVLENFLEDLDATPAPAKYAQDDANFRRQLPIAIGDLTKVLQAAVTADPARLSAYVDAYIADMVPAVTTSLDDVDPTTVHS